MRISATKRVKVKLTRDSSFINVYLKCHKVSYFFKRNHNSLIRNDSAGIISLFLLHSSLFNHENKYGGDCHTTFLSFL